MNFLPKTLSVLQNKGFEFMTPVQSQSYDLVYGGDDVVARSRTGTGKTFAFGLPLIERIVRSGTLDTLRSSNMPLILILEPTRELVLQVVQELSSVCAPHHMRVQAIYGGASFMDQQIAIRNGAHILVATPGRMLDHISRNTVDLGNIKHLVLDEGDTMLEMGFKDAVETIMKNVKNPGERSRKSAMSALAATSEPRGWSSQQSDDNNDDDEEGESAGPSAAQILLFSATMPGWICGLTDKHMVDPVFLDAVQKGETRLADTITHYAVRLASTQRRNLAVQNAVEDLILTKGAGGQTIIFTNTKNEADELVSSSCFGHLHAQVLHGDITQASRQRTIQGFKDGTIDVLVATDVAARGLDIAGVDLVVHAEPPLDGDTYVHRSGRTGRAGRAGNSVVLYSSGGEERKLGLYESKLNFAFKRMGSPSPTDIAEASAVHALKKLKLVQEEVVPYFLPASRNLIANILEVEEAATGMPSAALSVGQMENLLAKCLAAICNKNDLSSK